MVAKPKGPLELSRTFDALGAATAGGRRRVITWWSDKEWCRGDLHRAFAEFEKAIPVDFYMREEGADIVFRFLPISRHHPVPLPLARGGEGTIVIDPRVDWLVGRVVDACDPPGTTHFLAVALEEIGRTLGLPYSDDEASVMYNGYRGSCGSLDPETVAAAQLIYGSRAPEPEIAEEPTLEVEMLDLAARLSEKSEKIARLHAESSAVYDELVDLLRDREFEEGAPTPSTVRIDEFAIPLTGMQPYQRDILNRRTPQARHADG